MNDWVVRNNFNGAPFDRKCKKTGKYQRYLPAKNASTPGRWCDHDFVYVMEDDFVARMTYFQRQKMKILSFDPKENERLFNLPFKN